MSRDRMVLIALAAVTVIVVVAMMMKKNTPTDVSADSGKTATPPTAPAQTSPNGANAPAPTPAAPEVGTTKQDRDFRDPKNRFTIRVGQFDNDPAGQSAAQAAYRFLITEGLRVIAPVVASDGQHLVLCVGAEPKKDDLNSQLKWLHDARGPTSGKKNPYADAWIDNIDHVVRR